MQQQWDPAAVIDRAGRLRAAWCLAVVGGVLVFLGGFVLIRQLSDDELPVVGLIALLGAACAAHAWLYCALCHAIAPALRHALVRDLHLPAEPAAADGTPVLPKVVPLRPGEGIELDPVADDATRRHRATVYRRTGNAQADLCVMRYVRARQIVDLAKLRRPPQ